MTNRFLQFIKKQRLAIFLAQKGCLSLLEPLQSFRQTVFLASFFEKNKEKDSLQNLQDWVQEQKSLYLAFLLSFFAHRNEIPLLQNFSPALKNENKPSRADSLKNYREVNPLIKQIIQKDFPFLQEEYDSFLKAKDVCFDMRLQAAEIEDLNEKVVDVFLGILPEIDWIKTNKTELYLQNSMSDSAKNANTKSPQKIWEIFCFLFFEKSVLIDFSPKAYVSLSQGEYPQIPFAIRKVSPDLKNYLFDYLKKQTQPNNSEQKNLLRLIKSLPAYEKDLELFAEKYKSKEKRIKNNPSSEENFMRTFSERNLLPEYKKLDLPQGQDYHHLLFPPKLKKAKEFRKSSVLYWGPLFLLFLALSYLL